MSKYYLLFLFSLTLILQLKCMEVTKNTANAHDEDSTFFQLLRKFEDKDSNFDLKKNTNLIAEQNNLFQLMQDQLGNFDEQSLEKKAIINRVFISKISLELEYGTSNSESIEYSSGEYIHKVLLGMRQSLRSIVEPNNTDFSENEKYSLLVFTVYINNFLIVLKNKQFQLPTTLREELDIFAQQGSKLADSVMERISKNLGANQTLRPE